MEVKCWQCENPVQPHPKRHEEINFEGRFRRHPYPELSFICIHCKDTDEEGEEDGMPVTLCTSCNRTSCEWFYSLGFMWEDLEYCKRCKTIFCQPCYYDYHYKRNI